MPTTESATIEESSVEGSLPDQERTSPEPHPHVTRTMFLPSSHLGQPNDQRYAVVNQLAHYISRRSSGMHDATSCVHASGRTRINTAALNPEEIPAPSSAGPSVATTRVGSPGTDRKASWRAYTMSSDHSEPCQPGNPESIPPPISTLHPIPGLHANLYQYQKTPYVEMILAIDFIPNWYTLMAAFFTWILLAGFVLFPATFALWATRPTDTAEYEIVSIIKNMPL